MRRRVVASPEAVLEIELESKKKIENLALDWRYRNRQFSNISGSTVQVYHEQNRYTATVYELGQPTANSSG